MLHIYKKMQQRVRPQPATRLKLSRRPPYYPRTTKDPLKYENGFTERKTKFHVFREVSGEVPNTTSNYFLVGVFFLCFFSSFFQNLRKSNWIIFPNVSGSKIPKKYNMKPPLVIFWFRPTLKVVVLSSDFYDFHQMKNGSFFHPWI